MARVACVYVPFGHNTFEENLKVVDEDFGRLPPLSLAYAAAIAERAGHDVTLIDANVLGLSLDETIERLRPLQPQALCFTLSTYMFRETTEWMRMLRSALGVPTIAGGVNMRLYPEETVTTAGVDYGVLGFGLTGFPLLLEAIERGESGVGLPEIVARDESGAVVIGHREDRVDRERNRFGELPRPARHLLPNHLYYSVVSQRRNFTAMMTSTGCLSKCTFCAIAAVPYSRNTVEAVVAEVVECVERFDIHEIDFFDADFFSSRRWVRRFCQSLKDLDLDLEWSCRARLDRLDEDLLVLAKEAGCRQIYIGLETPDKAAQAAFRKTLAAEMVQRNLETMRRVGIRALGFFILGVPGETHMSALRTIAWSVTLPLDFAQFSRLVAKPGSLLHGELCEKTGSDYWRDYVLGRAVPPRIPNLWSDLDEGWLEVWTKIAYLSFYYRPTYVLRALLRMRSVDELIRSGRTAARMLLGLGHRDAPGQNSGRNRNKSASMGVDDRATRSTQRSGASS